MLNILKTGDLTLKEKKDKRTVKFTCPDCGCVFTADKGEYKEVDEHYCMSYRYKACPCCGRKNIWSRVVINEE